MWKRNGFLVCSVCTETKSDESAFCFICGTSTQNQSQAMCWLQLFHSKTITFHAWIRLDYHGHRVMFCQQKTDNGSQKILTLNRWWPHVHALDCRLVDFLSQFGVLYCPRWFVVVFVVVVAVVPSSLCYTLMWITKKCILLGLIWERAL